jgi:hypothetical protein
MKRIRNLHYREIVIKLFLLISLLALTLIYTSCYVTLPLISKNQFDVQIISDPPGARIEINGNYVGDAPLTVKIEGFRDRTFNKTTVIIANPIYAGQYVQVKSFVGNTAVRELNDKIPERILFIMDIGRAPN